MNISNILFITFIVVILIIVVIYAVIGRNKNALHRRLEDERLERERQEQERTRFELAEAKRLREKAIVEALYQDVIKGKMKFEKIISFQNGYFNNNKLENWKASIKSLHSELDKYKIDTLKIDPSIVSDIKQLNRYFTTGETIRTKYNKDFVARELKECGKFFSDIDGQSLDEQQRLAVIRDEDNNLVIAGAGSGKTTTVAGKVAYVINRLGVSPDEILLITFTRKASDEMKSRIKEKMGIDIEVNTFHSFGRKVIGEVTNYMPSVIEENKADKAMRNIFNDLFQNPNYAGNVIKFITEYRLETKDPDDFENHGEYIDYIKDNNFKSYKTNEVYVTGTLTKLREICKSLEEVQIANFLFLNGVNYRYEERYQYPTADNIHEQYKPDFYLPDYDIYIEHFGLIDRNNNVPKWFSSSNGMSPKDKYNADITWKREIHSNYKTTLLETYSYENREGELLKNLKSRLEAQGVVIKPRTDEEIWGILNTVAKDEVSALDTLINTFLSLFKSNNYTIKSLSDRVSKYENNGVRLRYQLFLEIFIPILTKYNDFLQSENLIDFSDMINLATKYISEKKFGNNYKYIIIDEFQDTSVGRFQLIKSLMDNNKECRLFAVGDDWQSIYRFAGSDISLFTRFEQYFGVTEFSKIETTYRFGKSMIEISSKFILTNPNQTAKELKPFINDTSGPIDVIYGSGFRNDDPVPLISALNKINAENMGRGKELKILALARYNHIIGLYKERSDLFSVKYREIDKSYTIKYLQLPDLEVQFLSVHRSKGLQGDYVILLNCVSGQYGFPSEQADDPILNLLLSKSDQFLNGEERRLFYVALTRSKRKTFITTNTIYKSKFIDEVDPNYIETSESKCPICKRGNRMRQTGINRNGNPYTKYTCSNWNFGCNYLAWSN